MHPISKSRNLAYMTDSTISLDITNMLSRLYKTNKYSHNIWKIRFNQVNRSKDTIQLPYVGIIQKYKNTKTVTTQLRRCQPTTYSRPRHRAHRAPRQVTAILTLTMNLRTKDQNVRPSNHK